jgi:hypothetical protein
LEAPFSSVDLRNSAVSFAATRIIVARFVAANDFDSGKAVGQYGPRVRKHENSVLQQPFERKRPCRVRGHHLGDCNHGAVLA